MGKKDNTAPVVASLDDADSACAKSRPIDPVNSNLETDDNERSEIIALGSHFSAASAGPGESGDRTWQDCNEASSGPPLGLRSPERLDGNRKLGGERDV